MTIDTGGTKTRLATFQNGKVARQIQYPTPRDPDEYIAKLAETIRQNFADNLTMIVLAVPGLVKNGTVVWHHRLGWRNFHIAD
ncbi:MAG: ROK family protein, partial [Candidatus Nomurabacteria bacterium]|nr:ROK family protein [Candidatus Nomurabacteria bacterium]